jgi:hypothetical protein
VSVTSNDGPDRVYVVLTGTPDEALEAVALVVAPEAEVEIVGGLSREMAKRMRLKPGEPQLV